MATREFPDSAPGKYVPSHPNPYYSPESPPVKPKLGISDQTGELVADAKDVSETFEECHVL
ncbi:hypothetical protein ACFFQF_30405 [Haladaptatus pallidirubidus]|uniref:Uncharacterized protein n=1 Tax=Haladaptatus pallidirubidus TaxID=1008152 RepID=A0AAV3UI10_9EURY|nr:hypothetical protein [Haladaptatus pallidirubidus]